MRRILTVLALAFALATVGLSGVAQARTTTVYYETVGDNEVTFIPACLPGPGNPTCDPRGAGSILYSHGALAATQGGAKIGDVYTLCVTTRKVGNDYYGFCTDVVVTPTGTVIATGEINESALERFVPQTLQVAGGGTLTVQQVVYPNVFRLTVTS